MKSLVCQSGRGFFLQDLAQRERVDYNKITKQGEEKT